MAGINKVISTVEKLPVIKYAVGILKQVKLSIFDYMPLWDVLVFFLRGLQKGALNIRASSMAFAFFLAIFPAVIFLFTLLAYIPIENFQEQLLLILEEFMPHNAYEASRETIEDIVKQRRGGLLSIGFLLALYFSTNGTHNMIDAFNKSFHAIQQRKPIQQRLISVLLTIILVVLLLTAIAVIIITEILLSYFVSKGILSGGLNIYLVKFVEWVVSVGLVYFGISFVYYLGPSRNKNKWHFFSAGSSLATLLIVITSYGFSLYINNFNQYNKLYGSIGTLIVILLWLYFNSFILLIGFELNVSIERAKMLVPVRKKSDHKE